MLMVLLHGTMLGKLVRSVNDISCLHVEGRWVTIPLILKMTARSWRAGYRTWQRYLHSSSLIMVLKENSVGISM